MSLTFTALVSLLGSHTKLFEGQTATMPISFTDEQNVEDGVTINKSDIIWIDQNRVLNATTENIDLSGSLTDAYGDAAVFVKVNGIYIHNKQTTAGEELIIGGAAANAFLLFEDATDKKAIGPDGTFYVREPSLAGIAVTAGTGDIFKLDAGAVSNLTFDIVIWGRIA